ncbi:MAG TPA: AzlC family ABC transporter permease [Gemmatimonadales bacterium]|nr:AzlC family ABC transporter permease [Gemmatimonadales bacterium]
MREPPAEPRPTVLHAFIRGALALLPLWAGAVPAGIAFGVAARHAGLGPGTAQLMSLLVFSVAGQMGAVSLLGADTPPAVLVATVVVLNAQLLLLSVTVGRQLRPVGLQRPVVAWFLTDGAYGIAIGDGPLSVASLLGAGASMYAAWNLGTALGSVLGDTLGDPRRFGVDLVVPLTFLSVLVPLLRTGAARIVALTSGLVVLLLTGLAPVGVAVLGAATAGAAVGTWWTRSAPVGPVAPAARRDVQP